MLLYIANSHPPENNIRMVAMIRIHTAVTCTCLAYTVHSTVISCTLCVCVCVCVCVCLCSCNINLISYFIVSVAEENSSQTMHVEKYVLTYVRMAYGTN